MAKLLLYPAIDLMEGRVVRLKQGKASERTVYSDNPPEFARRWAEEGADWLHLVDLDGAFTGKPANIEIVRQIVQAAGCPVELGGGMRSIETIRRAFDAGVSRVIIGTRAAESIDFITQVSEEFGGEKVAVGIDARNGFVAVKGWTESRSIRSGDLIRKAESAGAGTIIYTDIATDGMLDGPNYKELDAILAVTKLNVIASGGVSSIEDVVALAARSALHGVIIGKALYENRIDLRSLSAHPALRRLLG